MRIYRLGIEPGEANSEGEDHDEYFSSLDAAGRRRAELIREDPDLDGHRYGEDFEIERIDLADLAPRAMLLAILNRKGYIAAREVVVAAYISPEMRGYKSQRERKNSDGGE